MEKPKKSDGCRFCANEEHPTEIEFICGWCGRKKVFRLVEVVEETIILTEKATRLLEEQVAIPVPVCTG